MKGTIYIALAFSESYIYLSTVCRWQWSLVSGGVLPQDSGAGVSVLVIDHGFDKEHILLQDVIDLSTEGLPTMEKTHASMIFGIVQKLAPAATLFFMQATDCIDLSKALEDAYEYFQNDYFGKKLVVCLSLDITDDRKCIRSISKLCASGVHVVLSGGNDGDNTLFFIAPHYL